MRRPSVSGWFESALKYLTVCGLPSSNDFEVGFGESGDQQAVAVLHVKEDVNHVDLRLECLNRFVVLSGCWDC